MTKTRKLATKDPLDALITRREAINVMREFMRWHVASEHGPTPTTPEAPSHDDSTDAG